MTSYPGGKNGDGVYQRLINLIPPHRLRVELFLGSGAISRYLRPAPAGAIGIDIDGDVISAWAGHLVPGMEIIQADAVWWLQEHGGELGWDTFVYADPPYLFSTRGNRRYYTHEFGEDDEHCRLLELLRSLRCMVMVSGYPSELYDSALAGWRCVSYLVQTRGGKQAVENVWMNYPHPSRLHDYRYLGSGFRERERIKRKIARWQRRLAAMPVQERYAMLAALEADDAARAGIAISDDGGHAMDGAGTR